MQPVSLVVPVYYESTIRLYRQRMPVSIVLREVVRVPVQCDAVAEGAMVVVGDGKEPVALDALLADPQLAGGLLAPVRESWRRDAVGREQVIAAEWLSDGRDRAIRKVMESAAGIRILAAA